MLSASLIASSRVEADRFGSWFAVAKGLYAGVSASAMVSAAFRAGGLPVDVDAAVVAFVLVAPVYTHDACRDLSPQRGVRALLVGCAVVLAALSCANHAPTALASCAVLLSLGYAYAAWLKPLTRVVPAFKTIFVASCWATLVPLGCLLAGRAVGAAMTTTALFFFVQLGVNVAICDLEDVDADRREGLRTLAIVLGPARLRAAAQTLNLLSAAFVVIAIAAGAAPHTAWRLLPFCAWTAAAVAAAKRRRRSELFQTLVIDGTLLWPALLSWLADGLFP